MTENRSHRMLAHGNKLLMALFVCALSTPSICVAQAQDVPEASQDEASAEDIDEVTVFGTRQIIQDSISIKRDSTTIVDGLSADDIGDLPALSIGEALETITGASSHRENGGATEISIRGLGPFLGATTFNGREATNGSGDRSVNFSQFPPELMNKLAIYKTQDASLIEGGVSGMIVLETLKPLDYGKRRFQFDFKGNYNPDQQNIQDATEGDIGYRGTLSYVDQLDLREAGSMGFSFGYQHSDISQPEAEVRSSSPTGSSRYACINDPSNDNEGFFRSSSGDCEDQVSGSSNQGYQTEIDPLTGLAESHGSPFAFAPSSRGYRQNDTSDEREAFFGTMQWQPSENWDINLDIQISERTQAERRHDLNFANQKRVTAGVTGNALVVSDKGAILAWEGDTAIESNSELYERTEEYIGGGLNLEFDVNEHLTLSTDISYSETTREELQISLRIQSDDQDIYNMDTDGGYRPRVAWSRNSDGVPQYTITDFDVTDPTLFSDEYRVRIDSDVDRKNTIEAIRADFTYDPDVEGISSIQGGVRYSQLKYLNLGATRYTTPNLDDSSQEERDAIEEINQACANDEFPDSGFLSSVRDGNLITSIDSNGDPAPGTGNGWATFDTQCVMDRILAYHGVAFAYPAQIREHPATTDVTEVTEAAYLMLNYESALADFPVSGNIGVRVVTTDIDSKGWRTEYEIDDSDPANLAISTVGSSGDYERVSEGSSYTEWLPSFNMVMSLDDDLYLRSGIFRGLSRIDPSDMGYNRSFNTNSASGITDVDDLIADVSGSGNPNAEPLTSWNYDVAMEWYPNKDSILAVGTYYKRFKGGFEQVRTTETFTVDGQQVDAEFTATETVEDESSLYGIEFTGAHRFSYLPGIWSGLGTKLSYNYSDSNFEFEDSNYGSITVLNDDGSVHSQTAGIVAPGNIPGFSRHVFSGQLYWQVGKFDVQLIYKYRSEYFQPYTSNGTRLRYVDKAGVWEARSSYRLNDNFKLTVEAINLFDEPKKQYFYTTDTLGEVNVYGQRIFFGLKAKF